MKRIWFAGGICSIIFILTCGIATAKTCVVERLVDGDTAVCSGQRIRLSDIDAPEKKQKYGADATRFLANLINGKTVEYESNKKDQYGRVVARLYTQGTDVSLSMVSHGYAWAYYTKDKAIVDAMNEARECKLGLWQDNKPIAPWKYRKGIR